MATAASLTDAGLFTTASHADIVIPGNAMQQVLTALENPAYRWHSLNALARETNLPPAVVRFVLSEISPDDLVVTPSPNGYLYTTRRHYDKTKTWRSRIFSVLSDLPK